MNNDGGVADPALSRREFLRWLGGGIGLAVVGYLAACAPAAPVPPLTPARLQSPGVPAAAATPMPTIDSLHLTQTPMPTAIPTIVGMSEADLAKLGIVTRPASAEEAQAWGDMYSKIASVCSFPPEVEIVELLPNPKLGDDVAKYIPSFTPGGKARLAILANPQFDRDQAYADAYNVSLDRVRKALQAVAVVEERTHACTPDVQNPFDQPPFIVYTDPKLYIDTQSKQYKGTLSIYLGQKMNFIFKITKTYEDGHVEVAYGSEPGNSEELITGYLRRQTVINVYGANSLEAKLSENETLYSFGDKILANLFQAANFDLKSVFNAKQEKNMNIIFQNLFIGLESFGRQAGINVSLNKNDPGSRILVYDFIANLSRPEAETGINDQIVSDLCNDVSMLFYKKAYASLILQEQAKINTVVENLYNKK